MEPGLIAVIVVGAVIGLIWLAFATADRCAGCGSRWSINHRHRRKDGGADRRFRDNPLVCSHCGRIGPGISASEYREREARKNARVAPPAQTIAPPPPIPERPAPAAVPESPATLHWAGNADFVMVQGIRLPSPLTYWAHGTKHPGLPNPSTILLGLRIAAREDLSDPGYFPSYATISPEQRRGYLQWIVQGRKCGMIPLGYVFLHFYGLEWRAVAERSNLKEVVNEVLRLYAYYGSNKSFHTYASNLVGCILLQARAASAFESLYTSFLTHNHPLPPTFLEGMLRHMAGGGKGLPAAWALEVASRVPGSVKSVVVRSKPEAFAAAFAEIYQARFPGGYVIPAQPDDANLTYKWAGGITPDCPPVRYHSYLGDLALMQPLQEVWNATVDQLRGQQRATKTGTRSKSRSVQATAAAASVAGPPPELAWIEWYERLAGDAPFVATKLSAAMSEGQYAPTQAGNCRRDDARRLVGELLEAGIGMEPDPTVLAKDMAAESLRVVFRAPGEVTASNAQVDGLRPMIEVAMMVCATDAQLADEKWDRTISFLDRDNKLASGDNLRLRAYAEALLRDPSRLTSITAARFAKLAPGQSESMATLALTLALADGVISEAERQSLEKIYRCLGLPPERLQAAIHAQPGVGITIDWEAVARLQQETHQVQGLLAIALASDEADGDAPALAAAPAQVEQPNSRTSGASSGADPAGESIDPSPALAGASASPAAPPSVSDAPLASSPATPSTAETGDRLAGLDPRCAAVVVAIGSRREISAADLAPICKGNGLLLHAAIERINEWADEHCGDRLIDGDGPYQVALDILPAGPTA